MILVATTTNQLRWALRSGGGDLICESVRLMRQDKD